MESRQRRTPSILIAMAVLATQRKAGAHWYTASGAPAHRQPRKDGEGDRVTTVRDAKRLRLYPSVTSVLSVMAKPGLDQWKLKQVACAAAQSPKKDKETEEYYATRIIDAAFEQVDKAADLGTKIHAAIERYWEGEPYPEELHAYVAPVIHWKQDKKIRFLERERVLVNNDFGFAGTVDVVATSKDGRPCVLDFKTRKTKEGQKVTPYDGQVMQIAAYAATYWGEDRLHEVYGGNLYISSTEPGRLEVCAYPPEQLLREWEAFKALLTVWKHLKGYDPCEKNN